MGSLPCHCQKSETKLRLSKSAFILHVSGTEQEQDAAVQGWVSLKPIPHGRLRDAPCH